MITPNTAWAGTDKSSLSSTLSKIRRKLITHLGEELAEHYLIDGPNGEAKKIPLDRQLVDWNGFQKTVS